MGPGLLLCSSDLHTMYWLWWWGEDYKQEKMLHRHKFLFFCERQWKYRCLKNTRIVVENPRKMSHFRFLKFVIGVFQCLKNRVAKESLFRLVTVRWLELWKKSLAAPAFLFELGLLLNWLKSSFGQMKFCITCHHPPVTQREGNTLLWHSGDKNKYFG